MQGSAGGEYRISRDGVRRVEQRKAVERLCCHPDHAYPAPPWRTLRLTELTGAQLITAVAWGVVQGLAIWALIGAAIAVVIVAIRLVLAAG